MSSESYRFAVYTGGCQCGAVRFRATQLLDNPHLCYCRMCQKATGNLFAALVGVMNEHLTWTRGTPATYRSSAHVERGYCPACGTSLFYHNLEGPHVSLSIGAFDTPDRIPILYQMGMEGQHPDLRSIAAGEIRGTTADDNDPEWVDGVRQSSNQHPDHDTAEWPPENRA